MYMGFVPKINLGAIQVLSNAMGSGVYESAQISVTKVHSPTLLALLGGPGCQLSRKKHYVTLETPLVSNS